MLRMRLIRFSPILSYLFRDVIKYAVGHLSIARLVKVCVY
jgi:hypothetical protein